MSLEDQIDRLVSALDENTKALKGAKNPVGRPVGATKKRVEEEPEENGAEDDDDSGLGESDDESSEKTTKEQLRKLLLRVKTECEDGQKKIKVIMRRSNDAKNLDAVDPEDYASLAAVARKMLK